MFLLHAKQFFFQSIWNIEQFTCFWNGTVHLLLKQNKAVNITQKKKQITTVHIDFKQNRLQQLISDLNIFFTSRFPVQNCNLLLLKKFSFTFMFKFIKKDSFLVSSTYLVKLIHRDSYSLFSIKLSCKDFLYNLSKDLRVIWSLSLSFFIYYFYLWSIYVILCYLMTEYKQYQLLLAI